jgi:glycosyltransferase involved in cell wall biosynthesis
MKVLHISAGNLFGGIETVLVTMARERRQCPELKPHFSVCFEDRFSRELRATGAPVDYLGNVRVRNPLTILRARAALDRLLSQESIDVAICHSPWAHDVFGPVVKSHKVPLVFWSHGFVTGRHWLEAWARKTQPALVVCNSHATQATVKKLFPDVSSQVIYAPVSNSAHIRVRRAETKPVVVIQVSRMEKWKGHALLLEALAQLKDLPDWVCWVVGGAQTNREIDYEEGLHELAGRLEMGERVAFMGARDDVPDLLAQADIFCQPNLSPEPFGIVFIEALQSGIPVVSSSLGGAAEIVDDTCGILVPAGEVGPLASSLRGLIVDFQKRLQLGEAGPARAQALCDPARQLGKLREVLGSLV